MTLVVDASVLVAALIDTGPDGTWALELLSEEPLAAPHLMPAEVTNILRRAVLAGEVSDRHATGAHRDLGDLRVALFPYEAVATRVWELRGNVTAYDAWYVALAELLGAPLATLDAKLANAPGPRCPFLTPPAPPVTARYQLRPSG